MGPMVRTACAIALGASLAAAPALAVCGPVGAADPQLMSAALPDGPACAPGPDPFLTTCTWTFDLRHPAAQHTFASVARLLTPCGPMDTDVAVNHPDTYALNVYAIGGRLVSLSLKDKGARGQTFVFLRVRPSSG